MYQKQSGIILGFHGCDVTVQLSVLNSPTKHLQHSINDHDWLGQGIYFWENSPERALNFAQEVKKREPGKIQTSAVLGAIIDLGRCLDLLDAENLTFVKAAYDELKQIFDSAGKQLPENVVIKNSGEIQSPSSSP